MGSPAFRRLPTGNLERMLEQFQEGAPLLDVRMPEEFAQRAIQGAINLPLYRLREEIHGLFGTGSHVLVYCDTGERSAAAAFILSTLAIGWTPCTEDWAP